MIMHNLWTGGIQKVNMDLAACMDDPDIELTMLSMHPKSGSIFDRQAEENGIKVVYLDKRPGIDLSMIPKLNRYIRMYKPDTIHINQRMTTYALLPMLLNRIKRRYYVVHSLADRDSRGITRKINRFAFRHLGLTPVAISETCRKSIEQVYGLPAEKIPCIYNGVDTVKFTRKSKYTAQATCTFITVCAFRKDKNLPLLINAFSRVHKECPDTHLIMVGAAMEGEEYIEEELRNIIAGHGLEDAVTLTGRQSDIPSWLEKGQVYVLSSDYEGLPISVLEAMSMGLPVVATRAGGTSDVIENKGNGLLVRTGDEEGLTAAMASLAKNPQLREKFSKRSEELAEKYSMKACAENYARLYKGELKN